MKSEEEVIVNNNYEVSKEYWRNERGFSQTEYEQVIRNCDTSNFGFCESCMGAMHCERIIKGYALFR